MKRHKRKRTPAAAGRKAAPWLDGRHAVFGELVKGREIANAIGDVPRDFRERTLKNVTLQETVISRGSY
ncbi:MAG TPA: peptidylprolyl isomerase [Candidatus Acidoferrales bacterium]|nr:peptidylprolyl isomerase [Candidatus Acidoferrales bacterium]